MNSSVGLSRLQAVCLMTQFFVKRKFYIYLFVSAQESMGECLALTVITSRESGWQSGGCKQELFACYFLLSNVFIFFFFPMGTVLIL